jgi:hypothetical protein
MFWTIMWITITDLAGVWFLCLLGGMSDPKIQGYTRCW